MPQRGQLITLFDGQRGMDAGGEPQTSPEWIRIQNMYSPRRGALSKRNGTDRSTSAVSSGNAIAAFGDGALVYGEGEFHVFDRDGDQFIQAVQGGLSSGDAIAPLDVEQRIYTADSLEWEHVRSEAYDGGDWIAVAVHSNNSFYKGPGTSGQSYLWVFDKNTGVIVDSTDLSTGMLAEFAAFRFVRVGALNQIYYVRTSGGQIAHRSIATDGTISSATDITGALAEPANNNYLDVCVIDASGGSGYTNHVVVSFIINGGTGVDFAIVHDGDPTDFDLVHPILGVTAVHNIACWPSATEEFALAYTLESGANYLLSYRTYDEDGVATVTVAVVDTLATATYDPPYATGIYRQGGWSGSYTDPSVMLYTVRQAAETKPPEIRQSLCHDNLGSGSGVAETPEGFLYNARVWTKPIGITSGGQDFAIGAYTTSWGADTPETQSTNYIVDDASAPIARILPGLSRTFERSASTPYYFDWVSDLSDPQSAGLWSTSALRILAADDGVESKALVYLSIDPMAQAPTFDVIKGQAYIGGSIPLKVSNGLVVENGLLRFPEPLTVVGAGTGGGLTVGETYKWRIVYETTGDAGDVLQSIPTTSEVSFTADASNTKVTITIPLLNLTDFRFDADNAPRARIALYRTEGDGSIHYRETWAAHHSYTYGNTVNVTVGFVLDTALTGEPVLYTDDGILGNEPPPAYRVSAVHQGRHFIVPRDAERDTVRYSHEVLPTQPPVYHETLSIGVDEIGGDIKALMSHNDVLVIGKESAILAVTGEGATVSGAGASYGRPYIVNPRVGVKSARSVVRSNGGYFFQANDDQIWHLTGSMQLQPVGDPVRYYIDTYGPVNGAAAVDKNNHVIFSLEGAGAPLLVFDWLAGTWATYTTSGNTQGICVVNDVLHRLDGSGYVWTEDTANYDDNADFITMKMTSGWFTPADMDGMFRVKEIWVNGYFRADATLELSVGYDHDAYSVDEESFDPTTDLTAMDYDAHYGAGASGNEDQAFTVKFQNLSRQKVSAFQVDIEDAEKGGSGDTEGFTITKIMALVAPVQGTKRSAYGNRSF